MFRRLFELALCLFGLILFPWTRAPWGTALAGPGAPSQAAPPSAEPAPSAPGLSGLTFVLECRSFETNALQMGGDCHSGPILIKKAFFDRALSPKLADPGPDAGGLPVLGVKVLVYRRATPKEGGPEGALVWSYRGLVFWNLRERAAAPAAARGFVDVDSGRRFEGPAGRGYLAADLRTEILRAAAAELAERTEGPLRAFAQARGSGTPRALPRAELEKLPAPRGACRTWLGTEEMAKSIQEAALESAQATLARPELGELEGPWRARIKPCTAQSDGLVLALEGKKARAEALCPLRGPILAGESTGVLGQCAVLWMEGLRAGLLEEYAGMKR